MFVGASFPDRPTEPPNSDDPARAVRRLLVVLFVLALVAAGGAFALSQRGIGSSTPHPAPSLFPARFSEAGFLTGDADLVTSYDAAANARRTSGTVDVRETAYLVARCSVGTVHVVIDGLTSARACSGATVGLVALHLTHRVTVTATVSSPQQARWGVAIYR